MSFAKHEKGEQNKAFEDDTSTTNQENKVVENTLQILLDPKEAKRKRQQITKNVVLISIAFMVLFTSYNSMASLQSSINKVQKIAIESSLATTKD